MAFLGRYGTIAACVTAGALAASCGPSDSSKKENSASSHKTAPSRMAAAAGPIDPCKLLTKADARKVLGAPVTDGRTTHEVGFAPGTRCSYFTSAPMEVAGAVWSVSLVVFDQATFKKQGSYFASPTVYFERTRRASKAVSTTNLVDIPGIGDAAFWQGQMLHVLDRGVYLVVNVKANFHIPPGTKEKVEPAEDAAELAAAKSLASTVILPRLDKLR